MNIAVGLLGVGVWGSAARWRFRSEVRMARKPVRGGGVMELVRRDKATSYKHSKLSTLLIFLWRKRWATLGFRLRECFAAPLPLMQIPNFLRRAIRGTAVGNVPQLEGGGNQLREDRGGQETRDEGQGAAVAGFRFLIII